MTRHNKKRNSGLLYEFLIRSISRFLVEGDDTNAQLAKNLVKKYFASSTEIHKEYRLINALVNVPVGNEAVAEAVLQEARNASVKFDSKLLRAEKDKLIREINHTFGNDVIYAEQVNDYKNYATASTLIQYWRDEKHLDISTVVKYEASLLELLSRPNQEHQIEEADSSVDNLVVKIAQEKMNKKYREKLSDSQSEILNAYIMEANPEKTKEKISEILENTSSELLSYASSKNEEFSSKARRVAENIQSLVSSEVNDDLIEKALEVIALQQELKGVADETLN